MSLLSILSYSLLQTVSFLSFQSILLPVSFSCFQFQSYSLHQTVLIPLYPLFLPHLSNLLFQSSPSSLLFSYFLLPKSKNITFCFIPFLLMFLLSFSYFFCFSIYPDHPSVSSITPSSVSF